MKYSSWDRGIFWQHAQSKPEPKGSGCNLLTMNYQGIRTTLKAGSMVFGASALFLLIAPSLFLDLLGLENNEPMVWSMRMIAITLVALAGNMWNLSLIHI